MPVFVKQSVRLCALTIMLSACMSGSLPAAKTHDISIEAVRACIDRGIAFFHSISTQGGYGYENDLSGRIEQIQARFASIRQGDSGPPAPDSSEAWQKMIPQVRAIIRAQDQQGRWITQNDRYKRYTKGVRWNGEYETQDRISSAVFNRHIRLLCTCLERLSN